VTEKRIGLRVAALAALVAVIVSVGACTKKTPPVTRPQPVEPPPAEVTPTPPPPPPPPPVQPAAAAVTPAPEDKLLTANLDELNKMVASQGLIKPVFYAFDSAELSPEGVATLKANADVLRKYGTWRITIEGHCDERGTAEYNLALGERRSVAAKTYLVTLGIAADRIQTVSYGKEFPFDPGHTEEAWAKNRRAHFVITGK
jgi:peptidoglycan-associated lipoprotein